ncbi:putative Ig domain-containing protein [Shewanella benthica]|uniref:putative Ig domain-containing protein n=1 Tax=Shewanella benthica TaxID=43661 RepID=UPI00187A449F|nr:putative Ig domain-containing protein [Shewanella benthica]MBE7213927.1 hypothetical protein [Shewanella benthica]MCL1061833.1 putative Ig domain-containing protein [Shewanella benthica]
MSSLTLTLDNQTGVSVSDIGFTATIDDPTFMDFFDPVNVSSTCSSGSYSFTATEFIAVDYLLIAGQACTFTLDYIGTINDGLTVLGVSVTDLVSSEGAGTNLAGPVQLTVDPTYMTASLAISNASLSVGSVNTATITLGNLPSDFFGIRFPQGVIAFTDGVELASVVNFVSDCGGTNPNVAGSSSFSFPNDYANTSSCVISFDVVSTNAGEKLLISGDLFDIVNGRTIGKVSSSYISELGFINASFSPTALVPNSTATIDVSILNTDRSNPATNISFTDDLGSVLSGLVSTGDLTNVCGAGSSLTGTSVLTFTGGSLAAGTSCNFSINVAVPGNAAPGNYINTISAISYELDDSTINPSDALSSFTVNSAPSLSISTNQSGNPTTTVAAGDVISVEYVLTNVDIANVASSVSFNHELTGLPYFTAAVPADNFCNASGVATFTPLYSDAYNFIPPSVSFTGMTLAAGASCTFSVDYTVPDDFDAGAYLFSVAAIDATINSVSVQSSSPSASSAFTVDAAPQLAMVFNPAAVAPGSASNIKFAISHGAGSSYSADDIGFSLDLDAMLTGMTVQSLPSEPCGVGSTISGSTSLTLASGVLAPGDICEFSVPVNVPANMPASSYPFDSSLLTASINGSTLTSPLAAADLQITNVTFSKSFDPTSLRVGNVSTTIKSIYVINNADTVEQVSELYFNEDFSGIDSGVTIASIAETDVCGTGSSTTIVGQTFILFAGVLEPLTSCSFEVVLNLPANMTADEYSNSSSTISGKVNGNITSFEAMTARFTVNEISVLTAIDVSSPTSESSILMSIDFSDDVQNFVVGDIVATNATLSNFITLNASQYSVEVSPDADGTVTLNIAAGVAEDISEPAVTNTVSAPIMFEYQSVPLVPTPSLLIGQPSSLLTSASDVTYAINYTDVETVNLLVSAISLNTTGDANAVVSIQNGDSSFATVTLSGFTGDGSIGINVAAETARYSTNLAPAAGPSNVFVVDTHKPTVTLSTSSTSQVGDFNVNIVFEEAVADFTIDDISVINGAKSDFQVIDAQNYSVTVSASGETLVSIDVLDSVAHDSAGNGNSASNSLSITYDDLLPTVDISGPAGPVATSFTATIDFSEAVSGFVEADIQVVNANLSDFTDVDGLQYTVLVSPIAQASVELSIGAVAAVDTLGNGNTASNTFFVIYDFNDAPVISGIPATSVSEDSAYSFFPTYSDADAGDSLTFSIVNKPTWATFSTTNGTLSGVPTNDNVSTTSGIIISISDGALSSSLASFDIEVVNTNDAPTISGTPTTSVNEDASYSFTPMAADVDTGDSLTFSIVNKPSWATFSSVNGSLSGSPANDDVGTSSGIVISVSDSTVSTALSSFSITVVNTNDAPIISGSPATSVNEDASYSFTPMAADVDTDDSLSFSIVNQPSWATFSSVNGMVSGTPSNEDVGITSGIVISVSDGSISTPLSGFSITVVNTNDAPTISGSPATSVNEDASYSFTPMAADVDTGDSLTFSIVNKPSWATFSSVNGSLSGSPANDDVGISSGIVISVSDSTVSTALSSFSITVVNTNDAPTISGSPATSVNEDASYSFTPMAADVDTDDSLSFSIVNQPSWATFSSVDGTLSGTPSNEDVGITSGIVISVSDGTISTPLSGFSITVVNTNDAPTISGSPATSVNEGASYSFTPVVIDADTESSLTFSIVNQPSWSTFSGVDGTLSGMPSNDDVGITSGIVISVSDGTETVSLAAFSIEVTNVNGIPEISGSPELSVLEDENYSFTPIVVDEDADETLSFMITNKPSWASFDMATGMLSGTPLNADVGVYSGIIITVTDNAEGSDALGDFSIEVINVNDAPEFTSEPIIEIVIEQAYSYQLTAQDVDESHDISFSIVAAPDWLSLSNSGLISGTAPADARGEQFNIVIALTDGDVEQPVLQEYVLAVIEPTDTNLAAKLYFTPAPASPGQPVSLIIDISNTGLITANGVVFELAISDELSITELAGICSEVGLGKMSCQLDGDLAVEETSTTVIGLFTEDNGSGFANAELNITADNIDGETVSDTAQLLIAEVLSLVPGEILSSTPSEVGFAFDINNDTYTDLVSFNGTTAQIEVRLNDGLGTLMDSVSIDVIEDVKGMVAGDINGDGHIDIVTVGGASANSVAYLLEENQQLMSHYVLDAVKADVALIADLDGDGEVSVILAGIYQSHVAIYTGIGSGSESVELINFFALINQNASVQELEGTNVTLASSASVSPERAAAESTMGVTDLSLIETDASVQLIVSSDNEMPVLVQFDENIWQVTQIEGLPQAVERLVLEDIDGDGKLDGFSYIDSQWKLTIDLFGSPSNSSVNFPDADKLLVADVDDDGVMDILFVTPQGVSIWHYYAIDDIRVDTVVIVGDDISDVALVDIDNDGDLDLVTIDGQNGLSLWYLSLEKGFGEQEIDLALIVQATSFPQIDQAGTIIFNIINKSSGDATHVSLTISIPTGLSFSQLPSGCVLSADLKCGAGALAAGERVSITVWATAVSAGSYKVAGVVGATQYDIDSTNDSDSVTLSIPEPVEKSSDAGAMSLVMFMWLFMLVLYRRRQFR